MMYTPPPGPSGPPPRLILRPSRSGLFLRIAFLCLFAFGALALIRVSPQLGPVAYAFVGLPLLFVLDALLTFRTCLEIDESGISQSHYRSSWSYRWGEITSWSVHEMSSKGPNLVTIELHLAAGGRRRKLTPALVQYKDANYFKVRNALLVIVPSSGVKTMEIT